MALLEIFVIIEFWVHSFKIMLFVLQEDYSLFLILMDNFEVRTEINWIDEIEIAF